MQLATNLFRRSCFSLLLTSLTRRERSPFTASLLIQRHSLFARWQLKNICTLDPEVPQGINAEMNGARTYTRYYNWHQERKRERESEEEWTRGDKLYAATEQTRLRQVLRWKFRQTLETTFGALKYSESAVHLHQTWAFLQTVTIRETQE